MSNSGDVDITANENQQTEYVVAAKRLRDIEGSEHQGKDWGSRELKMMVTAVDFVRTSAWRIPVSIQAELEIRLYRLFKSWADQMANLQDIWRPMLKEMVDKALIAEEEEQRRKQAPDTEHRNIRPKRTKKHQPQNKDTDKNQTDLK